MLLSTTCTNFVEEIFADGANQSGGKEEIWQRGGIYNWTNKRKGSQQSWTFSIEARTGNDQKDVWTAMHASGNWS